MRIKKYKSTGRSLPVLLFRLEFDQYDFRAIVDTEGEQAISNTAAYDHLCIAIGKESGIIFWEESLVRCKQASEMW